MSRRFLCWAIYLALTSLSSAEKSAARGLGSSSSSGSGSGSGSESEGATPDRAYLSLIALGSVPARRYKVLGDATSGKKRAVEAFLLPPMEGSVPPSVLYFHPVQDARSEDVEAEGDEKTEEVEDEWSVLRVGFNRGASVVEVHAGVPLALFIRDHEMIREKSRGKRPEYRKYLKLPPLPPSSQVLCFLSSRNKGPVPWNGRPHLNLLNIQSKALRDKNVWVRNFSDRAVSVAIGDRDVEVFVPGQRRSYQLKKSHGYHRIHAMDKNRQTTIMNTSLRVPEGSLTLIVFHNAHPKKKTGKSIGVFRATVKRVKVGRH